MNIVDELAQLQELYAQGSLTDQEFAQAKALVLSNSSERASIGDVRPAALLDDIHFQNELAQLDTEWQMTRESYMVTGRYGAKSIPTEGGSLISGLLVGGFGIFWTISAASMGAPSFFPLFGVLFVIFGVGMSIHSFTKAAAYQQAEQNYQERRRELLSQRPASKYNISIGNEE